MVQETSTIRVIGGADVKLAAEALANAIRCYPFFEYCLGVDHYDRIAPLTLYAMVRPAQCIGFAIT